jgi:hypothetical protein
MRKSTLAGFSSFIKKGKTDGDSGNYAEAGAIGGKLCHWEMA